MSDEQALPHAYAEKWMPYRDPKTGEVVTLTWEQVSAVQHAVRVVDNLRQSEVSRRGGSEHYPPLAEDFYGAKSRALGRLLVDGKPLFEDVPPYAFGAADYGAWDVENSTVLDAETKYERLLDAARAYTAALMGPSGTHYGPESEKFWTLREALGAFGG